MSETKMVDIGKIIPNPEQPRKHFDSKEIESLAASMESPVGLVQPITLENDGSDIYILVDGERRYRAARLLGWASIEAVIRPISNHAGSERLLAAFVANEQRTNMNPMELAKAYQILLDQLGSIQEVARVTGKSEATINPHLQLLKFEPQIQALFERSTLIVTTRVTAALKRLDPEQRLQVANIAATRAVSEPVLLALCTRVSKKLPARRAYTSPERVAPVDAGGHFDAMNMVPTKMLPVDVIATAHETCQACALYDMASAMTCRECPMVFFLRRYP